MPTFYPKYFASKGNPLKPCLRCGSEKLYGVDSSLDGFFYIQCSECGLDHIGAFIEGTAKHWNKVEKIEDLRGWTEKQEIRPDVSGSYEKGMSEADERGIVGRWNPVF